MSASLVVAQRHLDTLAAWVEVWRPGSYPGGLVAAFAEAQSAQSSLDPAARVACHDRLARLALRVGLVLPVFTTMAGPRAWQHVCTVRGLYELWGVASVLRSAATLPPLDVRTGKREPLALDVWARVVDDDERRTLVARIELALWRAFDDGIVSVFRVSSPAV